MVAVEWIYGPGRRRGRRSGLGQGVGAFLCVVERGGEEEQGGREKEAADLKKAKRCPEVAGEGGGIQLGEIVGSGSSEGGVARGSRAVDERGEAEEAER